MTTPTNDAAQLKQGIWTEHNTALEASGNYTDEQLANMPAVGMKIEGDKGYFFVYTAEDVSDPVEGQITYNKSANTGTITFPDITGSPISGQTVSFTMTSDETMEFEFTYEGQKTTGACAWLCENLDNWNTEIDDADWKELMAYYETISEEAGPDASIDWTGSEVVTVDGQEVTVTDLDQPLVWDNGASTRSTTGGGLDIGSIISTGLQIFGSLFEEDPNEEINAKLDAVLGKLDNVLQNQQLMNAKLDQVNTRLIAIAENMKQQTAIDIINNRTQTYYNPLKVRNTAYFDAALKLYNDNKSDLSKVKTKLGDYAKEWVGSNEDYITLTWNYIEYLQTPVHSTYGTGLAKIYDGLTFDKYPWEHIGIGDRQCYRAYDMTMIAKCLFMINLYAAYGGGSDIKKEGIYNNYNSYKTQLKEFCEFKVTDPDKFLVCQIPGAHFVMHKEIQKYNYYGKDGVAPDPNIYGKDAVFRPEWHEAGSIKIENPKELKSKMIRTDEISVFYNYYHKAVFSDQGFVLWTKMLVGGDDNKLAAGAVLAKPLTSSDKKPLLLLSAHYDMVSTGMHWDINYYNISINALMEDTAGLRRIGSIIKTNNKYGSQYKWEFYEPAEYYIAIVEKRF